MNEEKKELLRELEENSGNLHQLRSEVALKEEQIGILQEKLEQQKTENIKAEEILSKEQSISETRRTEYEEKIQGARIMQERLEAELAQMTTSKAELSNQLEQMTTSHVNLETRLQEEQSTRAHIMSTNLQLEEAKASLTREAEEQNMQLTQVSATSGIKHA